MAQEITQKGINTGGGDVAGRDIYKVSPRISWIDKIVRKFKEELDRKDKTEERCESLDHYSEQVDIIGLEEKLKRAGMVDERIKRAMRFKEIFHKTITERRFYKSGQILYSELMARIYHAFVSQVPPLVEQNASQIIIDAAVSKMINEFAQEIGDNIDIVNCDQIEGIIYYLTGNCHIKWHKDQ